ncbi:sensory box histidine kinase PhoR [Spelaeicoccus albus]|nr:HAMP domain-containing sensor histidine kinase [Spelaeicoccus albus]
MTSRLVTITVTLLLLALIGTSAGTLALLKQNLMTRNDQRLVEVAEPLVAQVAPEILGRPGSTKKTPTQKSIRDLLPTEFYVQITTANGTLVGHQGVSAPGNNNDVPHLPQIDSSEVASHMNAATGNYEPFTVSGSQSDWRVIALPANDGKLLVAVALPLDSEVDNTLGRAKAALIGIGLIALALTGCIAWLAISSAFRPLRDIEQTATAIAAGDLSRRVASAPTDTELGRLSSSLNIMLGQIESAFAASSASEARMRRFVSDASHELRTPLVTIRGYAELYRQGAITTSGDLDSAMTRIENEATRMGGLVEDLVMLARLDEQRAADVGDVDMGQLARDAVLDTQAIAPDRAINISGIDGAAPADRSIVRGDEARLRQVVTNLIANAIRHTPTGTPIEIGIGDTGVQSILDVRDHGEGIADDQITKVFERFYRTDSSRKRDTGGSGLGLSIVAAIVAAHRGHVTVLPTEGGGATFRVSLPTSRTP